jgi:hypothetical protein
MMSRWAEIMTNMKVGRRGVQGRSSSRPPLPPCTALTPPPSPSPSLTLLPPQPKTYFLRPDVALTMGIAIAREVVEQKIMGKPDRYQLKA